MQYRIAFFTTDWNYEIGYSSMQGIQRFLNDFPDTSVYVFDCFGRYGRTNNDKGEFEIFHLPDPASFDGCVIQSNQILPEQIRTALVRKWKAAGVPVLSLNDEMDGCLFTGTDNYSAMRQIVEHLVYHHRLTRLSFVAGYPRSIEAQERQRAFTDVCREAGIPSTSLHYYDGSWEYAQGAAAAQAILTDSDPRPQALVCANDDMAIGACETLMAAGVRVPEDIIVTGFDNIGTAASFSPRLTTVERQYDRITCRGLAVVRDAVIRRHREAEGSGSLTPASASGSQSSASASGSQSSASASGSQSSASASGSLTSASEDIIYSDSHPIFSESCGCAVISPEEDARMKRRFFEMNRLMKNYYTKQGEMTAEMFDAESFSEIYDQFEQHAEMFGCSHVYLCVTESAVESHGDHPHHEELDEDMALVGIYSDSHLQEKQHHSASQTDAASHSGNAVSAENAETLINTERSSSDGFEPGSAVIPEADSRHVYRYFDRKELLPDCAEISTRLAVFYPLHYKEYCFGYIVLDGISRAAGINLIEATFTFIETAIENVRKKYLLSDLNQKLNGLYVTDSLTGLNNRFGFEESGRRIYGMISDLGGSAEILFIDMDNMKQINDGFGHKTGDQAIRGVADILRQVFDGTENVFLMRYGGDEFVVICPDEGRSAEEAIDEAVRSYNETEGMPFRLSLSIGVVRQRDEERQPLDSLIQLSDQRMYEVKKQHHKTAR